MRAGIRGDGEGKGVGKRLRAGTWPVREDADTDRGKSVTAGTQREGEDEGKGNSKKVRAGIREGKTKDQRGRWVCL